MKTTIQSLFIALAILFTASSCKKQKPELNPIDPEVEVTPKKLLEVTGMMRLYTNGVLSESDSYLWVNKKYDQSGKLMSWNKWLLSNTFEKSKGQNQITTYKYDGDKMVENSAPNYYKFTYTYSGNDTLEIVQSLDGEISQTRKYKYGSNGKPESITIQNENGVTAWEDKYLYNSKKQVITKERIFVPPTVDQQYEYFYDSMDNLVKITLFQPVRNARTVLNEYRYTYDSQGRVIDYTQSWGKSIFLKWTKTYDSKGEITKEEASTGPNIDRPFEKIGVVSYTYKYF